MQEVKVGKHKILLYSDAEEMPSWRFSKFNLFVLIDSQIGSTIQDVDQRFQSLYLMAKNEDTSKMKNEINNLRQSIYFVLSESNTSMMSFIALIYSIDGKEFNDLTDEGIKRMTEKLKDLPIRELKKAVSEVKKK